MFCLPFFFAFYSVYWYLNNPRLLVLLTITISLILILGLCAAYAKVYHRLKSEWVFLALLIAFLIIFIFIFPPFTVPDEGHHFFSTYWMVDSLPFNAHVTNDGGFLVRDIDLSLYKGRQSNAIDSSSFDSIIQNYALFENGKWTPFNEFSFSVSSENVSAKIGSIVGLQIGCFSDLVPILCSIWGALVRLWFFAFVRSRHTGLHLRANRLLFLFRFCL